MKAGGEAVEVEEAAAAEDEVVEHLAAAAVGAVVAEFHVVVVEVAEVPVVVEAVDEASIEVAGAEGNRSRAVATRVAVRTAAGELVHLPAADVRRHSAVVLDQAWQIDQRAGIVRRWRIVRAARAAADQTSIPAIVRASVGEGNGQASPVEDSAQGLPGEDSDQGLRVEGNDRTLVAAVWVCRAVIVRRSEAGRMSDRASEIVAGILEISDSRPVPERQGRRWGVDSAKVEQEHDCRVSMVVVEIADPVRVMRVRDKVVQERACQDSTVVAATADRAAILAQGKVVPVKDDRTLRKTGGRIYKTVSMVVIGREIDRTAAMIDRETVMTDKEIAVIGATTDRGIEMIVREIDKTIVRIARGTVRTTEATARTIARTCARIVKKTVRTCATIGETTGRTHRAIGNRTGKTITGTTTTGLTVNGMTGTTAGLKICGTITQLRQPLA